MLSQHMPTAVVTWYNTPTWSLVKKVRPRRSLVEYNPPSTTTPLSKHTRFQSITHPLPLKSGLLKLAVPPTMSKFKGRASHLLGHTTTPLVIWSLDDHPWQVVRATECREHTNTHTPWQRFMYATRIQDQFCLNTTR